MNENELEVIDVESTDDVTENSGNGGLMMLVGVGLGVAGMAAFRKIKKVVKSKIEEKRERDEVIDALDQDSLDEEPEEGSEQDSK